MTVLGIDLPYFIPAFLRYLAALLTWLFVIIAIIGLSILWLTAAGLLMVTKYVTLYAGKAKLFRQQTAGF